MTILTFLLASSSSSLVTSRASYLVLKAGLLGIVLRRWQKYFDYCNRYHVLLLDLRSLGFGIALSQDVRPV